MAGLRRRQNNRTKGEILEYLNLAVAILGVLGIPLAAFFWRQIEDANKAAAKAAADASAVATALNLYRLHVAETYTKQADFKDALRELQGVIHRELNEHNQKIEALFQKLDKLIDLKLLEDA